mgnify:CR=1 FL=1
MLERFINKRVLTDVALEVLGSFLAAVSIYNFALNGKFLMSGFSGTPDHLPAHRPAHRHDLPGAERAGGPALL